MFDLLSRFLPQRLAIILIGVWYAALAWAIFFGLTAADAGFRYWWL